MTKPATYVPEGLAALTADRVLVRLDVGIQVTPAGIVVPPSAQQQQPHGRVVLVGPDAAEVLAPGMRVIVAAVHGTSIEDSTRGRYVLYALKDIEAIIEEDEA